MTTSALDGVMMEMHRGSNMQKQEDLDFSRVVNKVINDQLILQDALAMGLDQETSVLRPVEDRRLQEAVKAYVRDHFLFTDTIPTERVRQEFETYYWKIQLSQLTVETEADARGLRDAVSGGAVWDSLASAVSLDDHRYRGGRHNLKYWADVEFSIRDAVRDLADGEVSAVFPYGDKFSIVRLDSRRPLDEADYARLAPGIRRYLLGIERQQAWDAFVAAHIARTPVVRNEEVIDGIRADSALVLRGEFRRGTEALALRLDDQYSLDETDLRVAVSRSAMENGRLPFDTHIERAIDQKTRELVLGAAADAAGYLSDPTIARAYERDLRTQLIEAYLEETIVPRIVFTRAEFEAYYAAHAEEFKEPAQVQLATLVVDDEAEAREMAARLKDGADFAFIEQQYLGRDSERAQPEARWSPIDMFSESIRAQVDAIEVGETSDAIDIGHSWLVFKLLNRRSGRVKDLSEVEPEIRQVMFDKKFREVLDAHLDVLKGRSEISLFQDAIDAYAAGGS